jgi:hypothetical protein
MEQANNQLMEQQQQHLVVHPNGSPDNNDGIDIHISQDDYNSITATHYTGVTHHHQQQQQGQDQQSHLQQHHQHHPSDECKWRLIHLRKMEGEF